MPREGLRLTTRAKTVLWIATILILLLIGARSANWTGFSGRTPWEYLDVFLVPVAVGVATLWFTATQDEIAQNTEEKRAQHEALQAYLDKMSELLIEKELHKKADRYHPMRVTARARTLTLLGQLDGERKRTVLLFLREARLINSEARCREGREVVLKSADLSGAILSGTDLSGAVLTNATVTDEQLATCKCLEGATMTDGQILKSDANPGGPTFEEWRKNKPRGEAGESSGP